MVGQEAGLHLAFLEEAEEAQEVIFQVFWERGNSFLLKTAV